MQQVHSYQVLVDNNLAVPIEQLLGYTSEYPELVLPELNENDEVVFKNISSNIRINPGINTIETIVKTIEKNKQVIKSLLE
jgi:hypothetical protein